MKHKPRKRFGQNFLQDPTVIERIVAAVNPQPEEHLVEIGPGQAALTRELMGRCQLDVIEIDRDLCDHLGFELRNRAGLICDDVLRVELSDLEPLPIRLVGNLPYNVSSPIIFHALKYLEVITDMHFMLQREFVERMAAEPGSKIYGRLSVMVQYFCEVSELFVVPPQAFYPAPKVDSAVVRLVPREAVEPVDFQRFEQVVRQAFAMRRKTLSNTLKSILSAEQIESAGVDPRARAETLSVSDFVKLARL